MTGPMPAATLARIHRALEWFERDPHRYDYRCGVCHADMAALLAEVERCGILQRELYELVVEAAENDTFSSLLRDVQALVAPDGVEQ